jgi:hypothetical protein
MLGCSPTRGMHGSYQKHEPMNELANVKAQRVHLTPACEMTCIQLGYHYHVTNPDTYVRPDLLYKGPEGTSRRTIYNLAREHHHSHQGALVILIINQDRIGRSRSLPPIEGMDMGKSLPHPFVFTVEFTNARFPPKP